MPKKQVKATASKEYWIYPNLTKEVEAALYYGFTPIPPLPIEKQDHDRAKAVHAEFEKHATILDLRAAELFAMLRQNFLKTPLQLPLMTIRTRLPADGKKDKRRTEYVLDIAGTTRSVADATLIQTVYEMVQEDGYEDVYIEINSLGDKDSFSKYMRELTAYFRKNISELHPDCRHEFKKGALAAINCTHEKCIPIKENAPHAINYLSEPSRTHFKEVLEFLEVAEIPYTINTNLIDNPEFSFHTVFKIFGHEKDTPQMIEIAHGARWANLAKRVGLKKDVQGVSCVMCIKNLKTPKKTAHIPKPKLYLIQMGQEAKLHSLSVIEILRTAKIPVYHSLTKDKFGAQLSSAEFLKTPYVLIIGQKESLENTVLVRDMSNRSQDTIRTDKLAEHLKKVL